MWQVGLGLTSRFVQLWTQQWARCYLQPRRWYRTSRGGGGKDGGFTLGLHCTPQARCLRLCSPRPARGSEWLYRVALLGVCSVHSCTTIWGLSPLPKSKTVRRGGRQEGERQEGLPGWPQYCAPLLSWLGLAATAACADPGWWEPRQQDWLIFIFF